MKNKKLLIAIVAAVLLVAGILLVWIWKLNNAQYKDLGKITYMKYSVDGDEYELVKKGKKWYWKDREDLLVENKTIDALAKVARKELGISEIETSESLKKLGLKNPTYSLVLKDSKGRKVTLHVGKAMTEDTYFVQTGSNKKVYTASFQIMQLIDSLAAERSVSEQMEFVGEK